MTSQLHQLLKLTRENSTRLKELHEKERGIEAGLDLAEAVAFTDCACDEIEGEINRLGIKEPEASVPLNESIQNYLQCGLCLRELLMLLKKGEAEENASPREYGRITVGMTERGLQVWCVRHDVNILHIDFEGVVHPGSTYRLLRPGEQVPPVPSGEQKPRGKEESA